MLKSQQKRRACSHCSAVFVAVCMVVMDGRLLACFHILTTTASLITMRYAALWHHNIFCLLTFLLYAAFTQLCFCKTFVALLSNLSSGTLMFVLVTLNCI